MNFLSHLFYQFINLRLSSFGHNTPNSTTNMVANEISCLSPYAELAIPDFSLRRP